MDKLITIYHGSEKIVEVPEFGLGFYCTESDALAMVADSIGDRLFANTHSVEDFYLQVSMIAGDRMKEVSISARFTRALSQASLLRTGISCSITITAIRARWII